MIVTALATPSRTDTHMDTIEAAEAKRHAAALAADGATTSAPADPAPAPVPDPAPADPAPAA